MHAMPGRDQSRQIRRPRRRADVVRAERPGETDAFFGKTVDMGRFDIGISIAAQGPGPVVIGHDEDNIRTPAGRERSGS